MESQDSSLAEQEVSGCRSSTDFFSIKGQHLRVKNSPKTRKFEKYQGKEQLPQDFENQLNSLDGLEGCTLLAECKGSPSVVPASQDESVTQVFLPGLSCTAGRDHRALTPAEMVFDNRVDCTGGLVLGAVVYLDLPTGCDGEDGTGHQQLASRCGGSDGQLRPHVLSAPSRQLCERPDRYFGPFVADEKNEARRVTEDDVPQPVSSSPSDGLLVVTRSPAAGVYPEGHDYCMLDVQSVVEATSPSSSDGSCFTPDSLERRVQAPAQVKECGSARVHQETQEEEEVVSGGASSSAEGEVPSQCSSIFSLACSHDPFLGKSFYQQSSLGTAIEGETSEPALWGEMQHDFGGGMPLPRLFDEDGGRLGLEEILSDIIERESVADATPGDSTSHVVPDISNTRHESPEAAPFSDMRGGKSNYSPGGTAPSAHFTPRR